MSQNTAFDSSNTQLRVVVIGAAGYGGAELVSILLDHPRAKLVGLFGSAKREAEGAKPQLFSDIFTRFRGRLDLPVRVTDRAAIAALSPDAIFLATPHEVSESLAGELSGVAPCILDLSAAFRFKDPAAYPAHYGFTHSHPELLSKAVYGLPELFRSQLPCAALIGVPGCYPTSAILPLAPLARAGAIARDEHGKPRRVIIDATSGVSGAGRALKQGSLFCEVSLQPYGVFTHRHNPEIDVYSGTPTLFTPHLGAYDRGILSTIHVDLAPGWDQARIDALYQSTYAHEPFIRLCRKGTWPSVADVRGTNYCDFAWAVDPSHPHLIIASAIDNLVKGAAGQAVQAMNARFGLDERSGLLSVRGTEVGA
jgi:N-acetyl-gamma-glutamyl-phosphate reductase